MAWSDMTKFAITRKRIWNYINQLIDNTDWLKDNIGGGGAGDMLKSVYDVNDNGIVDSSEYVTDGSTENTSSAFEIRSAIDDIDSIMNGGSVQGSYKTGWIACSDWTNAEFNITHNLNSNLSDLIVKFFISTDGTDANSFEINCPVWLNASPSGDDYGLTTYQADANNITIQTGTNGLLYIQTGGTGTNVIITTQSYYYKVAIYKMGDVLVSTPTLGIYDTGWVACSDWANQYLGTTLGGNLIHNLDAPLSDLIIKVIISTDGTDENSFKIIDTTRIYDSATPSAVDYNYGIAYFQIDSNNIKIQTGATGVRGIIEDTGVTYSIDVESWYYKIKVYKLGNISITPAEAFEVKNVAADYTLTSADNGVRELRVTPSTADITITLPYRSIRYGIDLKVINCGDGTYSVNVVTQGAETINGTDSVEITEANGWWKFCPGNATSTEWKTETDGKSTIYRIESSSNVGLTLTAGIYQDVLTLPSLPIGIYDMEGEGITYYVNTSYSQSIAMSLGIGVVSGNNAPIQLYMDSRSLTADYLYFKQSTLRPKIKNYENTAEQNYYLKAYCSSDENPTSWLVMGDSKYPIFLEARRIR